MTKLNTSRGEALGSATTQSKYTVSWRWNDKVYTEKFVSLSDAQIRWCELMDDNKHPALCDAG